MLKFVIFLCIFEFIKCNEKLIIPRGVTLNQRSLFNSLEDFTCFDGTLRLPFKFVNDDYCDCMDGSDEPGTSACPNGRFHCNNIGYKPLDLPASRVNDGVCDCCDASDEYMAKNCTNICHILGAEAKKAAEKEAEIISQGNELRLEMIAAGKELKQQKLERYAALESEKLEASRIKDEANRLKQKAENAEHSALEVYKYLRDERKLAEENRQKLLRENEAKEIFDQLDSNKDKIIQTDELTSSHFFHEDKNGEVSNEVLKNIFNSNIEVTWDSFFEAWVKVKPIGKIDEKLENDMQNQEEANLNNEQDSENFLGTKTKLNRDEEEEEEWDQNVETKNPSEEFIDTNDDENDNEDSEDKNDEVNKKADDYLPEKPEDNYDENTLKFIDEANMARTQYDNAERAYQDIERELTKLKESLEKDYGPEDEFMALDGQCFTYSDREYTYKLCPFDQVVQMGKSGGSETRLGLWSNWINDGQFKTMIYDKGQPCWNGPQRSTKVSVICGLETAIISASEPNKCEYELKFQTPSSCKIINSNNNSQNDIHDEF